MTFICCVRIPLLSSGINLHNSNCKVIKQTKFGSLFSGSVCYLFAVVIVLCWDTSRRVDGSNNDSFFCFCYCLISFVFTFVLLFVLAILDFHFHCLRAKMHCWQAIFEYYCATQRISNCKQICGIICKVLFEQPEWTILFGYLYNCHGGHKKLMICQISSDAYPSQGKSTAVTHFHKMDRNRVLSM